jgi:hypothetical protein
MIKPWQIIFLAVVAFLAVIFFIHHAKPKQKNYKSIFSTENYLEYGYTPDNYKEFYIEPPSVDSIFRNNKSKLNDIVNKFSPIYIFHSDERFYPASYGTLKNFCSLYKTVKPYNSEQIPTQTLLVEKPLTIKNMIDYTPKNFWDNNTVFMQDSDYSLVFTPSDNNYGNTQESQKTQLYNNIIEAYSYIVGDLNNPYFEVKDKTSFHLGSPGCPADWSNNLGVSCDKLATDILNANSKINWEPSPLFCYVVSKQIFQNGKPVKWVNNNWSIVSKDSDAEYVTDFIYQADFGFDGSISVIPGLETHTGDRTTVAVRFLTKDLQTNLDNAKPFRIYLGCHSGYSWYTPDKMLFRNINSDISYGRDTKDASHVIVY